MPKLPVLKPAAVAKVLESAGFVFMRQKGSHRIYKKGNFGVTVPWHNKELRRGTLKHIIAQSGMKAEDFR